jgi:hypothetical protein
MSLVLNSGVTEFTGISIASGKGEPGADLLYWGNDTGRDVEVRAQILLGKTGGLLNDTTTTTFTFKYNISFTGGNNYFPFFNVVNHSALGGTTLLVNSGRMLIPSGENLIIRCFSDNANDVDIDGDVWVIDTQAGVDVRAVGGATPQTDIATETKQDVIDGVVDAILVDTNELQTNQGNWLTAVGFSTHDAAAVKAAIEAGGSHLALILADTGELQTDWVNGGRLDLLLDAVLADTGELQADWVNGGRLDLLVDAILADTATTIPDMIDAIGVGDGSVVVDHDTGGADALAYKTGGGAGIDNAVVRAYLKSDYDAGNMGSEYIKATTTTDVNGRWTNQMNLDPATYTLYFFKQGAYGPDTQEVVVA